MRIHARINAGGHPNATGLAREIEVSSKTIRRDIDFMRDQLGMPIEYEPARHGYYYTGPVHHFPALTVSEGEMVALFVARKALDHYRGTPFEAPLKAAFHRLTQTMEEEVSFNWSALDSAISFRGIGATRPDLELFDLLSRATLEGQEVVLTYRKLSAECDEERRVHPYHLANVANGWYLFAHDVGRGEVRTFALTRISHARVASGRFEKPRDFDIHELLAGSFGVYSGTEECRVCLQFDARAARLVAEREWHPSQSFRQLPKSEAPWSLEMTMQLSSLAELTRWVLSWGSQCRVLAPEVLQQQVCAELKAAQSAYEALPD